MSNKGGRPTKLDASRSARIVALIRAGNYIETAAAEAGISATTFREWLKRGRRDSEAGKQTEFSKFADDIEQAQAASEAILVTGLATAAKKDWRAAAFLLERKWPLKFGSRQKIEHEGNAVLSPETAAMIAALVKASE